MIYNYFSDYRILLLKQKLILKKKTRLIFLCFKEPLCTMANIHYRFLTSAVVVRSILRLSNVTPVEFSCECHQLPQAIYNTKRIYMVTSNGVIWQVLKELLPLEVQSSDLSQGAGRSNKMLRNAFSCTRYVKPHIKNISKTQLLTQFERNPWCRFYNGSHGTARDYLRINPSKQRVLGRCAFVILGTCMGVKMWLVSAGCEEATHHDAAQTEYRGDTSQTLEEAIAKSRDILQRVKVRA